MTEKNEVATIDRKVETIDDKWLRWTFGESDDLKGEIKLININRIIKKRIAQLNEQLHYFTNDLMKEIMFNGYGINYNILGNDLYEVLHKWIPLIKYNINPFEELLLKYKIVPDVNYELPKDYDYESIFYK